MDITEGMEETTVNDYGPLNVHMKHCGNSVTYVHIIQEATVNNKGIIYEHSTHRIVRNELLEKLHYRSLLTFLSANFLAWCTVWSGKSPSSLDSSSSMIPWWEETVSRSTRLPSRV